MNKKKRYMVRYVCGQIENAVTNGERDRWIRIPRINEWIMDGQIH